MIKSLVVFYVVLVVTVGLGMWAADTYGAVRLDDDPPYRVYVQSESDITPEKKGSLFYCEWWNKGEWVVTCWAHGKMYGCGVDSLVRHEQLVCIKHMRGSK